jgi:hypothetical protein
VPQHRSSERSRRDDASRPEHERPYFVGYNPLACLCLSRPPFKMKWARKMEETPSSSNLYLGWKGRIPTISLRNSWSATQIIELFDWSSHLLQRGESLSPTPLVHRTEGEFIWLPDLRGAVCKKTTSYFCMAKILFLQGPSQFLGFAKKEV